MNFMPNKKSSKAQKALGNENKLKKYIFFL